MTIVEQKNRDGLTITQFVLSFIAFLLTLIAAAGFFAGGSVINRYLVLDEQTTELFYSLGSFSILLSMIHGYSLWNVSRKKTVSQQSGTGKVSSFFKATIALFFLALFCLLQLLSSIQQVCAPFYPFLTPLAVAIPAWWFVELGKRNLPVVTAKKNSAALSIGTGYTVLCILVLEIIFIALLLAILLLYFSSQPFLQQMMKSFSFPLDLTQIELPAVERYLRIALQNRMVVVGIFLVLGLIFPLIEEGMKPIALWSLQKRALKPTEGFILGLYFGAAFSLVESTLAISQMGSGMWVESIALRAATSLVHITCSGLVGYGYAATMKPQKSAVLPKPFLVAVLLHGVWNSLALLSSMDLIEPILRINQTMPSFYDILIPAALAIEWVFILRLLFKMNRKLHQINLAAEHNETINAGVPINDVE